MLRIKEQNLTCMINDSERITEKLGHGESYEKNINEIFDQQSWLRVSLNAQHEIQIFN